MNLLMEQTEKHIYVDELQAEAKIIRNGITIL